MKILITHPIHPGQFGLLANALTADGDEVIFLSRVPAVADVGYRVKEYELKRAPGPATPAHLAAAEHAILIGQATARASASLRRQGYRPDLIIGHTSYGELLFLNDIFDQSPILGYAEYYYRSYGADVGYDPELAVSQVEFPRIRTKNAVTALSLDLCATAYSPTLWQRNTFPNAYRGMIKVNHDGIDTRLLRPDSSATFPLPSARTLDRTTPIITFAARSLEHYRGFHKFWPALAEVFKRNGAVQVIIVGGDDVTYGPAAQKDLRQEMLSAFPIDLSRIHFFPSLGRHSYIRMLQVSSCHVYLTYPFVPSWSLLEAMACGCSVVAGNVPPVKELVGDDTCTLVDFFDVNALAEAILGTLENSREISTQRIKARNRVLELYDFTRVAWPSLRKLVHDTAGGCFNRGAPRSRCESGLGRSEE